MRTLPLQLETKRENADQNVHRPQTHELKNSKTRKKRRKKEEENNQDKKN